MDKTVTVFSGASDPEYGGPPQDWAGAMAWFAEKESHVPEELRHRLRLEFEAWVVIQYSRPETAEESALRAEWEDNRAAERRRNELALFAQLKAKFEAEGRGD